jgi:hypothetical protein
MRLLPWLIRQGHHVSAKHTPQFQWQRRADMNYYRRSNISPLDQHAQNNSNWDAQGTTTWAANSILCVYMRVCVFCEGFWFLKHLASIPNSILLNSNCLEREHFRLLPLKPPTNPNSILCNALQINSERSLGQWERALRNWLPSVSEPKVDGI